MEQTSRLSVNQSNQLLLSYDPTVNVGLSGYIPIVSWLFNTGNYKTYDSSSLYNKYGRWTFERPTVMIGGLTALSTSLGVRVSNTSGRLVLDSSHTIRDNYSGIHYTGEMRDIIPDC